MDLANEITSAKSFPNAVLPEPSSFEVRDKFEQCLTLYKALLLSLGEVNCRVVALGQVDVQRALEEYGRLKIWGQQTKATLSTQGSAGLDMSLRHEPQIREGLLEILAQISHQLDLAIFITQKVPGTYLNPSDQGSVSSLSSSSEYSSDSCSEGESEARPRVTKIEVLMSHIFEKIQLLYNLGSLLRRPGLSGRYLKSSNNTTLSPTELYDLQYVEEKLRQWKRDCNSFDWNSPEEEKGVTEEEIKSRVSGIDLNSPTSILSRRSAKANSQRRKQFKYWEKHPYQAPPDKTLDKQPAVFPEARDPDDADQPFIEDTATTVKASEKTGTLSVKTTPTAHSFSTIAKSAIFEPASNSHTRTIHAESVLAGKSTTRVPPVPAHSEAQFQCPCCGMNLDGFLMKNRMTWK
ncbi:hypothetical protein F5X99DRAFT_397088 [Biscogniauxia marginata]|nr:hypothetical protein F5X99DRAFT_397088 [Biscogniauxia marginata]